MHNGLGACGGLVTAHTRASHSLWSEIKPMCLPGERERRLWLRSWASEPRTSPKTVRNGVTLGKAFTDGRAQCSLQHGGDGTRPRLPRDGLRTAGSTAPDVQQRLGDVGTRGRPPAASGQGPGRGAPSVSSLAIPRWSPLPPWVRGVLPSESCLCSTPVGSPPSRVPVTLAWLLRPCKLN